LPKTGTTSLQHGVYPRLPRVRYAGKSIPGYGFVTPELASAMSATMSADGVFGDPARRLREAVAQLRREAGDDTLVVSTESLVHPMARDIALVADRLASAVPDARILITIRAQDALALSWFRSHGRFAMYLFLHKFESERVPAHLSQREWWTYVQRDAHAGLLAMLDLDAVVACYERRFEGRVAVLPLELLAADRARAAGILAGVLETDPSACEALLASSHENRGLSLREARLSRWLLRLGVRADFLEARDRSPLRRWLAGGPLADGTLDSGIASEIARRDSDGNARLAARAGLPLQALGYPCARSEPAAAAADG
jgi:hypothetical protein